VSADDYKPVSGDIFEAVTSIDRRLGTLAEDSRTQFELLTEKLVGGLTAITNQIASIAGDVGQLMHERVENRRRIDEHGRKHDDHARQFAEHAARLAELESRALRPRKK
jgi:hypothetical protein